MLHKRVTPTERVYEKVVEPSLGSFQAIPHTSHCCVRYQPSFRSPKSPSLCSTYTATLTQETTLPKIPLTSRLTRAVELGRHGPMYQSSRADASNLQRSATPNSFNSTTRVKQVPLPQVKSHERTRTPRGIKNVSISGDRYVGTSKSGQQYMYNTSSVHKTYPQYEATSLPKREQVQRFEEEQTNLYITRTMKRKSEILSHRVDRMYYLSGSGFPAQGKYEVNDSELQRLREFSRIRNNSRANSGRSSVRSGKSLTESSILTETRCKRLPLGSPLGSPRCTPVPRDGTIDLSVEGSGVIQEVKGHPGSNQFKMEDDRVGQMSLKSKDENKVNGDEKNKDEKEELCNSKTKDSSEKQNTSPHRIGDEECEGKDKNEKESDSGHERQKRIPGKTYIKGQNGEPEEDRLRVAPQHFPTDGDNETEGINKRSTDERVDDRGAGGDAVCGGNASRDRLAGDTLHDADGCHSNDEVKEASRGRTVDGRGAEGATGGGDASRDTSPSDCVQDVDNCHGDDNGDKEGVDGESISPDGEESVTLKHQSVGGRLIESIAPGLNLDKTQFSMKKSDVYLTKFVDPKHENLCEATSSSDEIVTDGKQRHNHDSQIANMENKLQTFNTLTQEVDDIGHLTGLDYERLEFKTNNNEHDEQTFDSGVFARAKSEEERRNAKQLREDRKEAKNTLKTEQKEAQRVREKAEKERALKQANKLKFKMKDVYNFISTRQREIFSQKFRELDTDGNGKITLKELTKKMHRNVPKEDIHHLHKVFDLNKDKTIDQREFVTVAALNDKLIGQEVSSETAPLDLNLNRLSLHITAYKEMFDVVDQNGDGHLSMDEIMLIITVSTGINIAIDKEAVRYIHNTIDKDGNGGIDFVEFLAFIPFFQKIHQQIIGKPVTIAEIEEARIAVKKAMHR